MNADALGGFAKHTRASASIRANILMNTEAMMASPHKAPRAFCKLVPKINTAQMFAGTHMARSLGHVLGQHHAAHVIS